MSSIRVKKSFLYHTFIGRIFLFFLKNRWISKIVGCFLSSPVSKLFIKPFIRKHSISLDDYQDTHFKSFNDFFTRKIKKEKRPINQSEYAFIAPCDGLLSVYHIKEGLVFPVKQSEYSVCSLLRNNELAQKYKDGYCLVFRLCVNHYHRYCYLDNGKKERNISNLGFLHTVRPVALENIAVFTENTREYTLMHTENFGDVTQIEVGAMLVGKIINYHEEYTFQKGEEKGMFLFGGSTIILLLEKDRVNIPLEYFNKTKEGIEIPVLMGEKIGTKIN